MNLYTESLGSYLCNKWDLTLRAADGPKEVRFIVQSLDPESVFQLFQALDTHRLKYVQKQTIKCHFRVATNLWNDWVQSAGAAALDERMAFYMGLGPQGERIWIDEEDRLTYYRNRTAIDENVDGLVVVLVGLGHATDQGGLKDFHQVDEDLIWRVLERSFLPWLDRLNEELSLDATPTQLEKFEAVLRQVFQIRPLQLSKLAKFLEKDVVGGNSFYGWEEFILRFFQRLPFWGIPPLFLSRDLTSLNWKKAPLALRNADSFISHSRYKTSVGQNKDWAKILRWLDSSDFELPELLDAQAAIVDKEEYTQILKSFVYEANPDSRARLLQMDLAPVLDALDYREAKEPKPKRTIPAYKGMSLQVILQGIWEALEEFSKQEPWGALNAQLAGIHVEPTRFDHDVVADENESLGGADLARELLQGCLGGLDSIFANIDFRLPSDDDEAGAPREQWTRGIPITLDLNLDSLTYGTSRARPSVQFKVTIARLDEEESPSFIFRWIMGPTQPERVRHEFARKIHAEMVGRSNRNSFLPTFQIPHSSMAAVYFAADEDEANRLLSQTLADLKITNLLDGFAPSSASEILWSQLTSLNSSYWDWLRSSVYDGHYSARSQHLPKLLTAFGDLAENLLDPKLLGGPELLRRVYKAFLIVDGRANPNDPYLPAAIAWGLTPAVLELTSAHTSFLKEGFPEALGELALGRKGRAVFERLLDLPQLHRPLAALLVDSSRHLSADIKSFGLLHYLGPAPSTAKSLAVQTLLRDEDVDDDEDITDVIRPCEERDLVAQVLRDYQQLYPYAQDGLRIIAVNVRELSTILAGVDQFLEKYLKTTSSDWPPFHCTVMVYSSYSSPMAMENRLALWRSHVISRHREEGRPLNLTVGHRYALRDKIATLLDQELRLYDIAFLFHFLREGLTGYAEPAMPFQFNFDGWSGVQFPIAEYPRPIRQGDLHVRQSMLSNRRFQVQSHHADLSARLSYNNSSNNHVIYGRVEYKPWINTVESLHKKSQWVACVDQFVDKRLIGGQDQHDQRKIVGFSSGLGAYGELNLTISSEIDSLKSLTQTVESKLTKLLPFQQTDGFEAMAARVVGEAEEIIGLTSVRAVIGSDEKIREVVGFAAIRRALAPPVGHMCQLLPIDSFLHWFTGSQVTMRPDLLQLSLEVRPNDIPLIHAVVIECKLSQQNSARLAKACEQVQDGLAHLTELLAPKRSDLRRLSFDRRYWWAQLHRAITSRSIVNLPEQEWQALDHALESLASGHFEIRWQALIFTFWTDEAGKQLEQKRIPLPPGTVPPPFDVPAGFGMIHLALGYDGLSDLFKEAKSIPLYTPNGPCICIRAERTEENERIPEEPTVVSIANFMNGDSSIISGSRTPEGAIPHKSGSEISEDASARPSGKSPAESKSDIAGALPAVPATASGECSTEKPNTAVPDKPNVTFTDFKIPQKILIGNRSNGEPVYWHYGHPQLANRHLLLFGTSGSGKTYGIQCLLAEMAQQGLRSLIVDYTDGFLPTQVEPRFSELVTPQNHYVVTERLPLNPFRRQSQVIDPSIPPIEDSAYQVASRIQSIFASVYEMGDQQSAALIRVLQSGIEENPNFSLEDILPRLIADSKNGETLASKIEPLIQAHPFRGGETAWDTMLTGSEYGVHVLQLKGLAREIQKLVTEFALWDLWDYAQNTGSKNRPIPIVLDEIQNLDHSSDSPIDKMLREGRKFGLSLILATQTTSQFNQEQKDRLFQAGHKLFFKPATTEVDRFAQLLASAATGVSKADWSQRLTKLEKGQCWSLGPVLKSGGSFKEEAVLVNVLPFEGRQFAD